MAPEQLTKLTHQTVISFDELPYFKTIVFSVLERTLRNSAKYGVFGVATGVVAGIFEGIFAAWARELQRVIFKMLPPS